MNDSRFLQTGNPGSPDQRAQVFLNELTELAKKYPLVKISTRNVLQTYSSLNQFTKLAEDYPEAHAAYLKIRPELMDLELLDPNAKNRKIGEILSKNPILVGKFKSFYWADLIQVMSRNLSFKEAWIAFSASTETDSYEEAEQIANFCMEMFVILDRHSVKFSIDPIKFRIKHKKGIIEGLGQVVPAFFSVDEFNIIFTSERS